MLIVLSMPYISNGINKQNKFIHFTHNQGLIDNTIQSVSQSNSGKLYVLSNNRLYSFDGYTFVPLHFINNQNLTFSKITIQGTIGFGQELNGKNYIVDLEKNTVVEIPTIQKISSVEAINDSTFLLTYRGNIYFVSYFKQSDSVLLTKVKFLESVAITNAIFIKGKSYVFLDKTHTVYSVKKSDDFVFEIQDSMQLPGIQSIKFAVPCDSLIFIGSSKHILAISVKNKKSTTILPLPNGENTHVFTSAIVSKFSSKLYVGTKHSGVFIFDLTDKTYSKWDSYGNFDFGLKSNSVHCLYEDNQENIWIGSDWKGGLQMFSPSTSKIEYYSVDIGNAYYNRNVIYDFEQISNNEILIAGLGGVYIFNTSLGTISDILHNVFGKEIAMNVKAVEYDYATNILWIGTDGHGLLKYNMQTKDLQIFTHDISRNSISNNAIYDLLLDNNGMLWIGSWGGGLDIFHTKSNKFHNFPIDSANNDFNVVTGIEKDANGTVWMSSYGHGLYYFNKEYNKPVGITYKKSDNYNNLFDLHVDSLGKVWCGSATNGIICYNPAKGIFQEFEKSNGFSYQQITSIQNDLHGNIWLTDNKQLFTLQLHEDGSIEEKNISKTHGISNVSFSIGASCIDNKGYLYFGTNKGMLRFHPDSMDCISMLPNTSILSITVNGEKIDDISNSFLKLKHNQNNIVISYSSLSFFNSKEVLYSYRLEGFDKQWKTVESSHRNAIYSNLPPGSYVFKVKSANGVGQWNTEPVQFTFTIEKPFWYSKWFYILLSILVIISLILIIKYRLLSLKDAKAELENLVKNRTAKIKEQSKTLQEKNTELHNQKIALEQENLEIAIQNDEIHFQNENLFFQKQRITLQTKQMTDSIYYAKNIQDALLHTRKTFKEFFTSSFILYKPKSIVSGDFYWINKNETRTYFICADCTGHGVHGAFMSVLCCALLNEIFDKHSDLNPPDIIQLLNNKLNNSLRSHSSDTMGYDGVELGVCVFDRQQSNLLFSGTGTPLLHKKNNEPDVVSYPVHNYIIGQKSLLPDINVYEIPYEKDDTFYFFTDGFSLQRGGDNFERFGLFRFIEEINLIKDFSFHAQEEYLDNLLNEWMSDSRMPDIEQNDDIIVVGLKIDELL